MKAFKVFWKENVYIDGVAYMNAIIPAYDMEAAAKIGSSYGEVVTITRETLITSIGITEGQ